MIFINNRIVVNPSKLYLEQFINGCINNELELEEKLVSIDDDTIKNNKIFLEYYSKSEVSKTTPVSCHILYYLSKHPNKTYFRSDPYSGVNISTPEDPRDGKLDLVIFNTLEKKLLIIESKKDLKSLIRDKNRDQWNKYKNQIKELSLKNNIKYSYFILIGGKEEEIYPKNSINLVPQYDQRDRFYEYIKDKRFVSLSFLHALFKLKIDKKNVFWENFFFNEDYKGLLSIGYIDKKQKLQPLKFK
jgi:hypothetical protein|tara:strand:+ start:334 stop:1068 length:735 start_codon:yes stop_codon:yes gene_type:complete